jgi:hypothetical protein
MHLNKLPILILILFPFASATAQWSKIKECGYHNITSIRQGGDQTLGLSYDGQVFASQDQGESWEMIQFPAGLLEPVSVATGCSGHQGALYVSFAYDDGGGIAGYFLLRSLDNGVSWERLPMIKSGFYDIFAYSSGVFMVQADGVFQVKDTSNTSVKILPSGNDKTKFFLSGNRIWRIYADGVSYSENEGETWHGATGGVVSMAVKGDTIITADVVFNSISRSIDNGVTWQPIQQYSALNLNIYANEGGFWGYTYDGHRLVHSDDGFATWTTVLQTATNIHDIAWHDGALFMATDRGIFRSYNYGSDWIWLYNGILPLLDQTNYFVQAAGTTLMGGLSAFSTDLGNTWISDPSITRFISITQKDDVLYGVTYYDGTFKSNGADLQHWTPLTPEPPGNGIQVVSGQLVSPTGSGLYRSPDNGASWEFIPPVDGVNTFVFLDDSLYGFKLPSYFYQSTDFGAHWNLNSYDLPNLTNYYPTFRSFGGRLYMLWDYGMSVSTDHGHHWVNHQHAFNIPYGPQNQGFVVNALGAFVLWNNRIWFSPDDGLHWIAINENLPHARYGAIAGIGNNLYTSDYQGNIWRRSDFNFLFNTILGRVFEDDNNNGQFDVQDRSLSNIPLATSSGQSACLTDPDGGYSLFYGIVPDTLKPELPSGYATIQPPFHLIQAGDTLQDFAVHLVPNQEDLTISITSNSGFVAGKERTLCIRIANPGTTVTYPVLKLTLNSYLHFSQASVNPTIISGDTLVWKNAFYAYPFDHIDVQVVVTVDPSAQTGSTLKVISAVKDGNGVPDITPSDNVAVLSANVLSAYDPNEKSVYPKHYDADSLAKHVPLDYTIRFQNTGNYTASFVYVLDTLSPLLDFNTFKLISSSHPVQVSARYGKILEFYFYSINLTDTITDEGNSHGFVRYSIEPKQALSPGTKIRNSAYIYFDYNAPVATNTVITQIGVVGSHEPPGILSNLEIAPNPSNGQIVIRKAEASPSQLTIFNATGGVILEQKTNGATVELNLTKQPPGCYWVNWLTDDGRRYVGKMVLVD